MQFTKAEEYGIFGVLYLVEMNSSRVVPLSEIAQTQEIPEKFLAKIFQSLSKAGIVRSHRGVRGGFTLGGDPEKLTVKDVLETIQGPYHLMKCCVDRSACHQEREGFCALREVLMIAERRLVQTFEEYSLADMVRWQQSEGKKRPVKAS